MESRQRVAVYVFRRIKSALQVLVFDHIDFREAGTQIPAGGLDPGEEVVQAALREVREETGLGQVQLIGEVGVQHRPHPHTGQQRHTTFIAAITGSPRTEWPHTVSSVDDDVGLRFHCYFLPVAEAAAVLEDHQGEFLDQAVTLLE